ncbi:MAG: PspC domain-containing protein [Bacteroidales bacterium]|nr:PspC domain-containing protein [Bacteroidales bacterium]MCF8398078.1 PspC domain-containing protein [Bacteroidales bacterium]
MKKTFNINISGIIFHIDEDAYQKLNAYLEKLKSHFRNTEGRDEIINDIESRIAEVLQEKMSDTKEVVSLEDVNHVIGIMGQPSDFAEEAGEEEDDGSNYQYYTPQKRLFRDSENKVIGGVSSGIAAYFNIDPIWIRLLFLITLFAGGTGILVYIILWIAMPETKTTADRLQMKGEPVNINNIEKSIREEFDDLKTRFNDLSDKAKASYKKKRSDGQTFFENLLGLLVEFVKIFGKVLLILIGALVIIIALSLLIPFLLSLFGWGAPIYLDKHEIIFFSVPYLSDMLLGADMSSGLFVASLILFIVIPLFLLLYLGIRIIFRIPRTHIVGVSAFSLWIISLIFMGYYAFRIANEFEFEGEYKSSVHYELPESDTLYLELNDNMEQYQKLRFRFVDTPNDRIMFTEDERILISPELSIQMNDEEHILFVEERSSRGKSPFHSRELARTAAYNYAFDDNTITFDKYFVIGNREPFRGQELDLFLRVPEGTVLFIDNNLEDILDWWHFDDPYDMGGRYWIMTENGLERSPSDE